MQCRRYDPRKDREAALRTWREVGWMQEGQEELLAQFLREGDTFVGDLDGAAECVVITAPGTVRHLREDLAFSCVAAVLVSPVARRQSLAGCVTSGAVAEGAASGALVAGLGVFDQGYYNRFGFGSGGYEPRVAFDPARLLLDLRPRVPRRLSVDDADAVHASRLARRRGHGACTISADLYTTATMTLEIGKNHFGLGYCDGPDGELTHHIWCDAGREEEHAGLSVPWMAYRTTEQFLELMALLKSLGDQVRVVEMEEPPGIQLQDLLEKPFREEAVRRGSRYRTGINTRAWWQMRINDIPGCLARTRLPWGEVRFNLELSDPIERHLPADAPWRGVGGRYVVTLGTTSEAEQGRDASLPTLRATVNAFTRLWLGVRPATGLAATDDLAGPQDLLEALDAVLCLPQPRPDWLF